MAWRRGQAYRPDSRARVLAALDSGATVREAAGRSAVSPSYCARARLRRGATGEVEARPWRGGHRPWRGGHRPWRGGHRPRLLAPHEAALRARLDEERGDATLAGLRAWPRRGRGVSASLGTVWTAVTRMGPTPKKRFRAAEQDRPDVAEARAAWAELAPGLDPDRLVFLDEAAASTRMARTDGWAPRGERLVATVPHGKWSVTTFVGALRAGAGASPPPPWSTARWMAKPSSPTSGRSSPPRCAGAACW